MVHYRKGINKTDIGNTENSVVVIGVLIEVSTIITCCKVANYTNCIWFAFLFTPFKSLHTIH